MTNAVSCPVLRSLACLVIACGAAACADDIPTNTTQSPRILEVRVEANPNNVVSAVVHLRATGADRAYVEYGTDTLHFSRTPTAAVQGDSIALPVLGLAAATEYHIRVVVLSAANAQTVSASQAFTTGALPSDIPPFTVTRLGSPSPGYVMFSFTSGNLSLGGFYALIVDNDGRVVWYRKFEMQITDFQRQSDGNFTVYSSLANEARHFYELDALGNVVAEHSASGGIETGAHEYRRTDAGEVLFGLKDSVMDLTALGGKSDATVQTNVIEYRRPGAPTLVWRSVDHMTVDEMAPDIPVVATKVDPWHCNAIDIDTDGNLLVSFRNSDEILKVDKTTGDVLWRLGGRKNQFTFINDPLQGPSHQHGIRRLPNGHIILFDNGNLHVPPESRAVEYRLDESAHTAELVWEYRHQPPLFAFALGFSQRIADGHTLVCYGAAQRLVEVDASNQPQWELAVGNTTHLIYRAFRIASLY